MNLHGVSLKSRVFDPTNLFEEKVKPSLSEECLIVLLLMHS